MDRKEKDISVSEAAYGPYVANESELWAIMSDYFDDFSLEVVKSAYAYGSPWRLLKLFTLRHFVGDFDDVFKCPNSLINWHLCAIAQAISIGSVDLKYTSEFVSPFFYSIGMRFGESQGKLFYSFLYFVLSEIRKGNYNYVEVGAGEGKGGINHDSLYRVLGEMYPEKHFGFQLYDPLQSNVVEEVCNSTIHHCSKLISENEVFEYPVYCDIINNHNWDNLQYSLVAPSKMMKKVYRGYGNNMLIQPFHHEVRIYENKQFVNFIRSYNIESDSFCNCVECHLWLALSLEFNVPIDILARELRYLGVRSCKAYAGAGYVHRLMDPNSQKNFDVSEFLGYIDVVDKQGNLLDKVGKNVTYGCDNANVEVNGIKIVSKQYASNNEPVMIASIWANDVIDYLKSTGLMIQEIVEVGTVPLVRFDLSVCKGDGIPYYHDYKRIKLSMGELFCESFKITELDMERHLLSLGYVIIDKFEGKYKVLLHCKSTKIDLVNNVEAVEVEYDWFNKLPGELLMLPCLRHDKGCFGPWCLHSTNFAIWKCFGKMVLVKLVAKSNMSRESIISYHKNYAFSETTKWIDLVLNAYLYELVSQLQFKDPNFVENTELIEFLKSAIQYGAYLIDVEGGKYTFLSPYFRVQWYQSGISVYALEHNDKFLLEVNSNVKFKTAVGKLFRSTFRPGSPKW